MCLDRITRTQIGGKPRIAYKTIGREYDHTTKRRPKPVIGKTYTARKVKIDMSWAGNYRKYYNTGFHAWASIMAAKDWSIDPLYKVKLFPPFTFGIIQHNHKVIIGHRMQIIKEIKRRDV